MALDEDAAVDPASRHAGKAETEAWLLKEGIPFTSFRPTYIVGPGNYNLVERWFDRVCHGSGADAWRWQHDHPVGARG